MLTSSWLKTHDITQKRKRSRTGGTLTTFTVKPFVPCKYHSDASKFCKSILIEYVRLPASVNISSHIFLPSTADIEVSLKIGSILTTVEKRNYRKERSSRRRKSSVQNYSEKRKMVRRKKFVSHLNFINMFAKETGKWKTCNHAIQKEQKPAAHRSATHASFAGIHCCRSQEKHAIYRSIITEIKYSQLVYRERKKNKGRYGNRIRTA